MRIEERLRGARLLGFGAAPGVPLQTEEAIELIRTARLAIAEGKLSYAVFTAAGRP